MTDVSTHIDVPVRVASTLLACNAAGTLYETRTFETTAFAGLAANDYARYDGTDWANRTIAQVQADILGADLVALEALATTGMSARTGAGTWSTRTITGGATLSVADGDGVAGNPTLAALPAGIDHDSLLNYVLGQHLTPGAGLAADSGAGTTLVFDIPSLTNQSSIAAADSLIMNDTVGGAREITLAQFEADLTLANQIGWDANDNIDHTAVSLTVAGTASEITSSAGAQTIAASRTWTLGLADNATLPGSIGMTVPIRPGTGDPAGTNGRIYYNTADAVFRAYQNGGWTNLIGGGGGGGSLNNIVEDVTPQLGGMLDVNSFALGGVGGLELLSFTETGAAVNNINLTNAATGNRPLIGVAGGESEIGMYMVDSDGAELLQLTSTTVAAGINYLEVVSSISGTGPIVRPSGDSGTATNVDLNLESKGTGVVNINGSELMVPIISGPANWDLLRYDTSLTPDTYVNLAMGTANQYLKVNTGATALAYEALDLGDATDGTGTNAKLADMAAYTLKLRNNVAAGVPQDVAISGLSLEAAPAALDFVMIERADGSLAYSDIGNLPGGGGGLNNIVEDVTPQLGAMLDVNTFGLGDGTRLLLDFVEDGAATTYVQVENQAAGTSGPIIRSFGEANVDLNFETAGTGVFKFNGDTLMSTNITGSATGDVLYYNASGDWVNLGVGLNGEVLTLAAGIPSWAAGGGGGNTLDSAYDQGGVGAGRTVEVTDGAVRLRNTADVGGGMVLNVHNNVTGTLTSSTANTAQISNIRNNGGVNPITDDLNTLLLARTVENSGSGSTIANGSVLRLTTSSTQTSGTMTNNVVALEVNTDSATDPVLDFRVGADANARYAVDVDGDTTWGPAGGAADTTLQRTGVGILDLADILDVNTGLRIAGSAASGNVLRGNGTNFVSAALVEADISNLGTAIALVADNLSVFGNTTSAQLAGIITNETGSGLLVFGTSPTIVTPTIASFASAAHDHADAAGGGAIALAAVPNGTAHQHFRTNAGATAPEWYDKEEAFRFSLETPVAGDLIAIDITNKAITVTEIQAICDDGTTVVLNVRQHTSVVAAGGTLVDQITPTTSVTSETTISSALIPADRVVFVEVGVVTGSVTSVTGKVYYTED